MDIAFVLFGLRLLSGIILMVILGAFFVVLWRDYRSAAAQVEITRRTYGSLIKHVRVDDMLAPTGDAYPLRPLTSIGRSPTNSIVIKDDFASGEHALVSLKEGRWWLEDRNSRNGTQLNGDRITSATIITDDDIISIGNSHFKITLDT